MHAHQNGPGAPRQHGTTGQPLAAQPCREGALQAAKTGLQKLSCTWIMFHAPEPVHTNVHGHGGYNPQKHKAVRTAAIAVALQRSIQCINCAGSTNGG
jgi:hypothetical protein